MEYTDYPLDDVINQVVGLLLDTPNARIHQKWTCSYCGARQTMSEANKFFTSGKCEECSQITKIEKCNYLIVADLKRR